MWWRLPNGTALTGFSHEDTRHGTTTLFAALAVATGLGKAGHYRRRRRVEFLDFMTRVIAAHPGRQIHVILDNLNTHTPAALYEAFPPAEAGRIRRKLDCHSTPVHGSWLNMAELEFSMLSRQCLNRRIGDRDTLVTEVAAWEAARNEQRATIHWQFTVNDARRKLHRLYPS